ncbi:WXG100 family type VII secretion target [Actinospica sp. MGRD01-02]|uniref:ESAT-6-like protein n=1 Tax=Actinospica acidithermotolerans TaxID=2828514 RepID=A0A941EEH3_9ACTN|nr:WXG100 family type VII secretion target [Actinospica acidithermotolerans]MBR7826294.1 WXG100 family type VII secretion target [Actinospica acidithermotolerans]
MAQDGMMLVTFAELANAAQTIQQTSNNLNQKLDDLKSMLNPIAASWQGKASENYQVQQRKWDQAQSDINQVLQAIGKAVEAAHDAYTSTENANAAAWS